MFRCAACGGGSTTLAALKPTLDAAVVKDLLQRASSAQEASSLRCHDCAKPMREIAVSDPRVVLDICLRCTLIWFDAGELEHLPPPSPNERRDRAFAQAWQESSSRRREGARRDAKATRVSYAARSAPTAAWAALLSDAIEAAVKIP